MPVSGLLKSPHLRRLYAYWDEKRAGRAMPARADIDPAEMVALLPLLVLLDVETAPRRYRYRVVGTAVAKAFGEDPTGGYFEDADLGGLHREAAAGLDRVVDGAAPGHLTGEFSKANGRRFTVERLSLPLSSDGETVNMILNGCELRPLS